MVFRHGIVPIYALMSLNDQSENEDLQRCGGIPFNFAAHQTEIVFGAKIIRGVERIIKIFPHLLFDCES